MNKLVPVVLFSLATAVFIIALHQMFTVGLAESYGIFMLSVIMLLLYYYLKRKKERSDD